MSSFLSLNWKDLGHSLLVAIAFAIFAVLQSSMTAGTFHITWNALYLAIAGAVINTLKQWLTNSTGSIAPEPPATPSK